MKRQTLPALRVDFNQFGDDSKAYPLKKNALGHPNPGDIVFLIDVRSTRVAYGRVVDINPYPGKYLVEVDLDSIRETEVSDPPAA